MKFPQKCLQAQTLRPKRYIKHEKFPSITFPVETKRETRMRFLFFKKSRLAPRPNPASANHLAAAIYCFCSCFFRIRRSGTRLMLCALVRQRGTGAGDVARPCGERI